MPTRVAPTVDFDRFRIPETATVLSLEEIVADERIRMLLCLREGRTLALSSIDGFSGSGKSTLTRAIKGLEHEPGAEMSVVEAQADWFVTTNRDSPQRIRMTQNEEAYWETVYDAGRFAELVQRVVTMGTQGGRIDYGKTYRHRTGRIEDGGHLAVPAGPKLVLADGIGVTHVLKQMGDCPKDQTHYFVYADPGASLTAAMNRSTAKGLSPDEVERRYRGEYACAMRRMMAALMTPGVIVLDNTKALAAMAA